MSGWFSSSYMARRGVAAGRVGKTHQLTEARQGSYQYVYGPHAAPALTIAPGDVVVAETLDAFGGAIKSVNDKPSEKLTFPFVNPQNGPIAVEGAEKGDVLAARIAYRELIRWLVADYGFDELEAYFLLTQAGRMRVGNMVDPKYTLGASILKEYLPSK